MEYQSKECSRGCEPKLISNDCDDFTLFIGDLASFVRREDIEEAFSSFGNISSIRIKFRKGCGNINGGYGFIRFVNRLSAVKAMEQMDGFMLKGRALR